MKKKGFTLIELLGVIVIISIVAIIAIPLIAGVINKTKIQTLKISAYGLLDAIKLYYAEYEPTKNIRFDITDNKITSKDVNEMISYKGSIKEGSLILNKNGKITICITDGANSAYKNYDEDEIILIEKKTCSIPENKTIVYLEGSGATKSELSNQELTDLVSSLQEEITTLKSQLNSKASKDELNVVSSVASDAQTKANSAIDSTKFETLSTTVLNNQTNITNIQNGLSNYYTKSDVNNLFNNYYDKAEVDAISTIANNAVTKTELGNYYTKSEIQANYYNKTAVDAISTVANSKTTLSEALDKVYPVGSIYITVTENTVAKVKAKFGGTWVKLENTFLYGTSGTSNQTGGQTSVSYTPSGTVNPHQLTIDEMPSHTHGIYGNGLGINATGNLGNIIVDGNKNYPSASTGGSQPHSHTFTGTASTIATMPPYTTVYMYKRTA